MTNDNIIIDSSKYAGRLYQLVRLGFKVKVIYVVREPSMVVNSFSKKNLEQPSKHWLKATIYYFFINLLCKITLFLLRRDVFVTKIKYEDFISNPISILKQIDSEIELSLDNLINKLKTGERLIVGNLFDGNRIRLQNEIKIIPKDQMLLSGIKNIFVRVINKMFY